MDNTNEQLIGGNEYGQHDNVNLNESMGATSNTSKKDMTLREATGHSALVSEELPNINVTGSIQVRQHTSPSTTIDPISGAPIEKSKLQ